MIDYNYTVRFIEGRTDVSGLSLYEAQKVLQQAAREGSLADAAGVYHSGRFVAFFCRWRSVVRPAFEAADDERQTVLEDGPFLATLR